MIQALKERYRIFQKVKELCIETDSPDMGLAVCEKLYWILSFALYPYEERGALESPCILKDDGCVYGLESDTADVLKTGDFISHESLTKSTLTSSLFAYYNKSPYWDVIYGDAILDNAEAEFMGLGEEASAYSCVSDCPGYDFKDIMEEVFTDRKGRSFFEREAIDIMDAFALNPLDYFTIGYEETAWEYLVFRSRLLPFYFQFLKGNPKLTSSRDRYCRMVVEEGILVLSEMLNNGCMSVGEPGLAYSYYLGFTIYDGYCYPYGTYSLKAELLLAGEIIDKGILCLNEKYQFIPKEVLKEVLV